MATKKFNARENLKQMINTNLFKGAMYSHGYNQPRLAERLGISVSYLNKQINNKHPFTLEAVAEISGILGLTSDEIVNIFFSPDSVIRS